uniref:Uncharacterized protein n=1 Tax=Solanum tuberosum TaxID=4113 RepID=M1DRA3_SOLTU
MKHCFAEPFGDSPTAPFYCRLDFLLQGLAHWNISKTQVQQFKKDVSNNATQDSIMNAHKKTQITHARVYCALEDSSCDSPVSKNPKLTILLQMQVQAQQRYSNALTQRMIPYSHTMVQQFKVPKSNAMLTLTKMNTMHDFTHMYARIFQSTLASAHSRSKRSFQGL